MAEIVIKKWQCDRCKRVWEEKPKMYFPKIGLDFYCQDEYSDRNRSWRDICNDCQQTIKKVFYDHLNPKN